MNAHHLSWALQVLALTMSIQVAYADPLPPEELQTAYDEVAPELIQFAADESGLPSGQVPWVVFLESQNFAKQYAPAHAVYNSKENIVILSEDWRPDVHGRASLLHELVHYMQTLNDFQDFSTQPYYYRIGAVVDRLSKFQLEHLSPLVSEVHQTCLAREKEAYEVMSSYLGSGGKTVYGKDIDDLAGESCMQWPVMRDRIDAWITRCLGGDASATVTAEATTCMKAVDAERAQ